MRLSGRATAFHVLLSTAVLLCGCGAAPPAAWRASIASSVTYTLSAPASATEGAIAPVRDPSLIHVNGTYYLFITDNPAWIGSLPMLCSADAVSWKQCGSVFAQMPWWIPAKLPGISNLWAPDISWFDGEYHVYYTASLANTKNTIIGLATNTTLNPADPNYKWVDRGEVLESNAGDEINVLDPNVLVGTDGRAWLSYGSYWGGIAQREIDPATGMLKGSGSAYALAARPDVPVHPIEGSSQVFHDGYYYLFVSIDYCCNADLATNNYKMAVGRSADPHGPFVGHDGTPMLQGGSTEILTGDGKNWMGVGGGTVYDDRSDGETDIVFHAQNVKGSGEASLFLKKITWTDGWPVVK